MTNVLPFTEKGRVASPVETMAGGAMPPMGEEAETLVLVEEVDDEEELVAGALDATTVALAAEGATVTVPVTTEHSDSVEEAARTATAVATGASMVTVLVTIVQSASSVEELVTTALPESPESPTTAFPELPMTVTAALVVAAAATLVAEAAMVETAMTEPGVLLKVAVAGIWIEAVMVLGAVAVAAWVEATDAQLSFWEAHSSTVKPAPEKDAHAVN